MSDEELARALFDLRCIRHPVRYDRLSAFDHVALPTSPERGGYEAIWAYQLYQVTCWRVEDRIVEMMRNGEPGPMMRPQ